VLLRWRCERKPTCRFRDTHSSRKIRKARKMEGAIFEYACLFLRFGKIAGDIALIRHCHRGAGIDMVRYRQMSPAHINWSSRPGSVSHGVVRNRTDLPHIWIISAGIRRSGFGITRIRWTRWIVHTATHRRTTHRGARTRGRSGGWIAREAGRSRARAACGRVARHSRRVSSGARRSRGATSARTAAHSRCAAPTTTSGAAARGLRIDRRGQGTQCKAKCAADKKT
jgi:hypothetical protein